jgi:DNA-binding HxlR family transcriptional regulator
VRFNEFQQALGTIPPATLAQRLTDLEEAGVLERSVVDSRPPYVEYRLTQRGRQLRSLVNALSRFAEAGAGTA